MTVASSMLCGLVRSATLYSYTRDPREFEATGNETTGLLKHVRSEAYVYAPCSVRLRHVDETCIRTAIACGLVQ